jgi:hypothetical protein
MLHVDVRYRTLAGLAANQPQRPVSSEKYPLIQWFDGQRGRSGEIVMVIFC